MILVLDLGSSSTRALFYDAQAQPVLGVAAREACAFQTDRQGRSEDDAPAAWQRLRRLLNIAQGQTKQLHGKPIAGVAMASYVANMLCLDERGEPISPVITYADTRASDDAKSLRAEFDELKTLQRTGCRIRANYHPAKLRWLARTQPKLLKRTRWLVSLSDYLRMKLCGARSPLPTSYSIAAWTGLLNRHTLDWDEAWLRALNLSREQLPTLDESPISLGAAAQNWPMLAQAKLCAAIGDGAAANVGTGCVDNTCVAATIGTTAAMRIASARASEQLSPALWCYRVDQTLALVGGATSEGGNVIEWVSKAFKIDLGEAETVLLTGRPDGHGLTVLPMFAGERSPGFADHASGTIHGLRLETRPIDILRACMEGIAYRMAIIHDSLRVIAMPDAPIVVSGGALMASSFWRQMLADVTNIAVHVCREPEATARGVAMLALWQLDRTQDLCLLAPPISETHQPDADHHEIYQYAIARQQSLYRQVVSNQWLAASH